MKPRAGVVVDIIILSIVVALSYVLAGFAPFLSLDDMGILNILQTTEHNVRALFFAGGGDYFRPLTSVAFVLELKLFGRDPAAFHLFNVSIHFANTLLVYYLAKLLLIPDRNCCLNRTALVSALLFAVHPVNVEAVMWVAGITDLLCCLFFLLALIVVAEKQMPASRSVASLFFLLLLSLLSKEASVGLAVILLLFWFCRRNEPDSRRLIMMFFSATAATVVYFFMRAGFNAKLDSGVSKVLSAGVVKPFWRLFYESVAGFGFYVSKAIFPFPLNFAIVTINQPLFFCVAVCVVVTGCFLFFRYKQQRLPILMFSILLIPPLLALHGKLPWTPYAERYLYLPMVGFVLMVGGLVSNMPRRFAFVAMICLILLGLPTMQRVGLWADSKAFWLDVMKKSPEFARSYVGVAVELLAEQKYDEAEILYDRALKMGLDRDYVWQGLAKIRLAKDDMPGYERAMVRFAETSLDSTQAYIILITTLTKKKPGETTCRKTIEYYLRAQEKNPTYGDGLYNAAKVYLYLGDSKNALKYFKLFLKSPGNSMYRQFAESFVRKLEDACASGQAMRL